MHLPSGDPSLGASYASAAQRARVISEAWVAQNGYCLACESDCLLPTSTNTQARDFECLQCGSPYELKSTKSSFQARIVDGAYASMMRRIETNSVPNLLLLQYTSTWQVANLTVIHRSLLTSAVIQQRKPLAASARRAGWVGCNILLASIPPEGRIPLVSEYISVSKEQSRRSFARVQPLTTLDDRSRNWAALTLTLLRRLNKPTFTTADAYSLAPTISLAYPRNRHIEARFGSSSRCFVTSA